MKNIVCIFTMVTLCAIIGVHSLNCYVCTNCTTVSDNDLKSCDAITTSTSTPAATVTTAATTVMTLATTVTTPPTTVTTPPTTVTTPPTTVTPQTSNNTAETLEGSNNTSGTPEGSNKTAGAPEDSNNTAGTPEGSNITVGTPAGSNNTAGTPEGSNKTAGTPEDSNNTAGTPEDSNNTAGTPEGSNKTSGTPEVTNNTNIPSEESNDWDVNPNKTRKRRSAETSILKGCFCENGQCDFSGRSEERVADNPASRALTYQCYKHVLRVNGQEVVNRGCQTAPESSSPTVCSTLNITTCRDCTTDKCNSGLSLQFSIGLLVMASSLSFLSTQM